MCKYDSDSVMLHRRYRLLRNITAWYRAVVLLHRGNVKYLDQKFTIIYFFRISLGVGVIGSNA